MKGIRRKELWDSVCKIDGMIGFLGGDNPRPMSEDEIASVRKYLEQKEDKKLEFKEGDSVKILDGPFAGNIGTIAKKNDTEQTALVEFNMFGEDMSTEVAYGSLELAE
jgi:transcriptional antiterminator NusG